ncbi:hypothetical protein ACFL5H_02505 [Candidatus Latescibacterota bacterium]
MNRTGKTVTIILSTAFLLGTGCAAFRSDIGGAYQGESRLNERAEPVSAAFIFTHVRQTRGFDAVPKLDNRYRGFDDFFRDALPEITNIGRYATFNERAEDVNDPVRRAQRDSLAAVSDYVIRMRFLRETSFARQALGTIVSSLTVTLLPVPYTRTYAVTADVYDRTGRLVKRYERTAKVTQWIETFLLFVYPFHPETRKTEEVYVAFLHDIFREIEADRILAASP